MDHAAAKRHAGQPLRAVTMLALDFFSFCKNILITTAPDMSPDLWWVTAVVFFILALTAAIDIFTTTVPDPLILFGLFIVTAMEGWFVSWPEAALHLQHAIEAGIVIWLINWLWYLKFNHDALGMGDAKWTALSVACFGFMPNIIAWGVGACLAVIWLGGARAIKRPVTRVTFAPFLLVGLMAGIYWLRLRA